ncbi:MAG: ankyrin repeat domain-containing protein [Gemmatimonadaceae bacterium]
MERQAEFVDAVRRGDVSAVAHLLDRDPALARSAGEHGKTGLHWAAETDQPGVAALLLDAGAELEARTSWGASPLDWAATMGGGRVADLLLSRGASGLTLVVAAGLGKADQVRAAIESGADLIAHRRRGAPEVPDDHWPADSAHLLGDVISDAMYAAARNGHVAVVEYLLDRGAAVDAKGVFGATALHWAAINGHRSTADLLVARGADLAVRDVRFNATPAEWAEEGGHTETADALRPSRERA